MSIVTTQVRRFRRLIHVPKETCSSSTDLPSRTPPTLQCIQQAARGSSIGAGGEGKIGSKVFSRLRNRSTDGTHSRYGSVKVRAPSSGGHGGGGGGRQGLKPPPEDEYAQRSRVVLRRDEREVVVSGVVVCAIVWRCCTVLLLDLCWKLRRGCRALSECTLCVEYVLPFCVCVDTKLVREKKAEGERKMERQASLKKAAVVQGIDRGYGTMRYTPP